CVFVKLSLKIGLCTETFVVAVKPPKEAVTVTEPTATPIRTLLLKFAIVGSLELQVAAWDSLTVPVPLLKVARQMPRAAPFTGILVEFIKAMTPVTTPGPVEKLVAGLAVL